MPDGGEDDRIATIESQAQDDITYHNWDGWRESLQQAPAESDISAEDVDAYIADMKTIAKSNNVRDYVSLIGQVADNPDEEFHDTANEAGRAAYYATHGRTVIVEPDDDGEIDLKTIDSEGNIEYIELKRITGNFDQVKFKNLLGQADGKFSNANIDTSDSKTVLEIRLPNAQNSVNMKRIEEDSTVEEIEVGIKSSLRTRRNTGVEPPVTDVVRVFLGDEDEPTIIIDTDEIYTNGTEA